MNRKYNDFIKKTAPIIMGAGIVSCRLSGNEILPRLIAEDSVECADALYYAIKKRTGK